MANKKLFSFVLVLALTLSFAVAVDESFFVNGKSGKDTVVLVETVKTDNIRKSDSGYNDMILMTDKIISLLSNNSELTVTSDAARKSALQELKNSQSGLFEEDEIEIGNFKVAEFIVTSKLNVATSSNAAVPRYVLSITVADTETGKLLWSSDDSKKYSQHDLYTGKILNDVGAELLQSLGVSLSEIGKAQVSKVDIREINRMEILGGLNNTSATTIGKLYYGYSAEEFNISTAEIRNNNVQYAEALKIANKSGNIKTKALTEAEVYKKYQELASEVDDFFSLNPPFTLVYDTKLASDTKLYRGDPVVDITGKFKVVSNPACDKILTIIKDGIYSLNSDSLVRKEMSQWPWDEPFVWLNSGRFRAKIALTDRNGNVIATTDVVLDGSRYKSDNINTDKRYYSFHDIDGVTEFHFKNIDPNSLDDEMIIEVVEIKNDYYKSKYYKKNVELDRFKIRTLEEYLIELECLKEKLETELKETKKVLDKEYVQYGRTGLVFSASYDLFGSQTPWGAEFSAFFGNNKFLFTGGDIGISGLGSSEANDYDCFARLYLGTNVNIGTGCVLFAEAGLGGSVLSDSEKNTSYDLFAHAGAGLDIFLYSKIDSKTGVYKRFGLTGRYSFDYRFFTGSMNHKVSAGIVYRGY